MSSPDSRRHFFKVALGLSGLALLAPKSVFAEEKRRAKAAGGEAGNGELALPLVEPGKGMATSLNYQYKNSDLKEAALKVERSGVPFKEQRCDKCMLYTAVGKKGGTELGKCSLFANQLVKSTGWCASWSKKA